MIVLDITRFLDQFAPRELSEPWDNVGLLLGDSTAPVERAMTCLTLTPDVATEAIREGVTLVITHHPIMFRPIKRLTAETVEGAMLLRLVQANVAVYSPHTAFDSAREGINTRLCERLGVQNAAPLRPHSIANRDSASPIDGSGRYGELVSSVDFPSFVAQIRKTFSLAPLEVVTTTKTIARVAVACGSAAEYLTDAQLAKCDALVTGEARFHSALEARSNEMGLVLLGHYASERFAIEDLAKVVQEQFPDLVVWASRDESDPLQRL